MFSKTCVHNLSDRRVYWLLASLLPSRFFLIRDSMDSVVNSFNEWDPLEEVIVGTCFGASSMGLGNEPVLENLLGRNFQGFLGQGIILRILSLRNVVAWFSRSGKPFPMDWLEKAAAELDNLSRVLQNENVIVRRPDEVKYDMPQSVRQ